MPSLDTMQIWVVIAALAFAAVTFLLFLLMMLGGLNPESPHKAAQDQAVSSVKSLAGAPTPAEVAELVKALAAFSDSLMKAGPRLWTLMGSILFLLIAAIAAGLLHGAPGGTTPPEAAPSAEASVDASAPATPTSSGANDAPVDENMTVKH